MISADNNFALWAVILLGSALSFWAGTKNWGRRISGVSITILLAITLSNSRIIPTTSPVYDTVFAYLVPLSIPLLLFDANLLRIWREAGRMLIAFTLGTIGTVVGVLIALPLIDLGPEAAKLGGIFAATYIGGSMNFIAVAQATNFDNSSLMAASVAADNIVTVVYLIAIMALPGVVWLRQSIPSPIVDAAEKTEALASHTPAPQEFDLQAVMLALGLAFAIAAVGNAIAGAVGAAGYGILFITALALVPPNFLPRLMPHLKGHHELGMVAVYVFLFCIGATADVRAMLGAALPITGFALVIVTVHFAFTLIAGWLVKLDLAEIIIASNACIGGSSSAGPIAAARGWNALVTPGILVGVLGNAIATFIGFALVKLLA